MYHVSEFSEIENDDELLEELILWKELNKPFRVKRIEEIIDEFEDINSPL